METAKQNLHVQKWVAFASLFLLSAKVVGYYLTNSVAILTDALESIVNVAAGFIGLYSLFVAAKPRDKDHPYGHGKAEFLSAAVEGTLIVTAGAIILYKVVQHFIHSSALQKLDIGIVIIAATALVNYIMGAVCISTAKRNNSLALLASGKHLHSDAFSTIGIIAGLILVYFTGETWIDSAIAVCFALFIIYTGYKILRRSIAGIMDEADVKLLTALVDILNSNRRENWIDLHNLRVIKYGSVLHVDCHLTVPWYLNVYEAHQEIDALAILIRKEFGETLELFVHSDGCLPFQCKICQKSNCNVRQHEFVKRIPWTLENISQNKKHQLKGDTQLLENI